MPRIKLASWYGDKAPGEEIDVDDVTAKALRRDGRVAEPEQARPKEERAPVATAEKPAQPDPAVDGGSDAAEPTGRKRR